MTPKEQYEARKAARKQARDRGMRNAGTPQDEDVIEIMDRFVTAIERIADSLEKR